MIPRQTFVVKCPDDDTDVTVTERPRIAQSRDRHRSVGKCPTCGQMISRTQCGFTGKITVKAYRS